MKNTMNRKYNEEPEFTNVISVFAPQVALENMDVFKDSWERQVRLLTEAVDDITTIDDFLAVSGMHRHLLVF